MKYVSQIHFPKCHAAHFLLPRQQSGGRKQRIRLSGNHKILHRHRFYELTCKRNTLTSDVTVCRKYATLLAKSTVLTNGDDEIFWGSQRRRIISFFFFAPPVMALASRNNFPLLQKLTLRRLMSYIYIYIYIYIWSTHS